MTIMMMMMMMIMTDPFTTNLVVKGPVVKGSVVKGATSVIIIMRNHRQISQLLTFSLSIAMVADNKSVRWQCWAKFHPKESSQTREKSSSAFITIS